MSLERAFVASCVIETSENYTRADDPFRLPLETRKNERVLSYENDRAFWRRIFRDPEYLFGATFHFDYVMLSEWVARIPGLYWTKGASQLRQLSQAAIESENEHWIVYRPWGKSQKVMGGVGTLRFPYTPDGTRLVTLTSSLNASTGVPVLILPDVWNYIQARGPFEGAVVSGEACWQSIPAEWASRFKITRDIPRGCLVLDNPNKITVFDERAPIQIHPFTIMKYYSGSSELFDYVYATAYTGEPNHRLSLERFFDNYKDSEGRYGQYLIASDMVNPLWESVFATPADLRRADLSAESQMNLLEARVHERQLGEATLEPLLEALALTSTSVEDLRRWSQDIGIPPARWHRGGTLAEVCAQFLDEVVREDKLCELVHVFATVYPDKIK